MAMLSRLDTKNILFIHNVLLDQILYIYKIHFHTAHTISIDDSIKIPTRTGKYPSLCVEHSRFLYQCLSLFHLLYIYIYIYIYMIVQALSVGVSSISHVMYIQHASRSQHSFYWFFCKSLRDIIWEKNGVNNMNNTLPHRNI